MKLSLEKINKWLLLVALATLIFRGGVLSTASLPKPFELLLCLLLVSTAVDVLVHRKARRFFGALPRKIWIFLACLFGAIVLGWMNAIFIKHIAVTHNAVLEFGTLIVALATLVIVACYANGDDRYKAYCFYALLTPAVYIFFALFPGIAEHFGLAIYGNFVGFTDNVNIVSKILLVPAMFFTVFAISESILWRKAAYAIAATCTASLLFWTVSRGGLVSFAFGAFIAWLFFSLHEFQWKKSIVAGVLVVGIAFFGFLITPYSGKQLVLNRILNPDTAQSIYAVTKNESISQIIKKSVAVEALTHVSAPNINGFSEETRLIIWPYYLKLVLRNPIGLGPNTHMPSYLVDKRYGGYLNTGPHNTYLDIWLWGGIPAFLIFLYVLYLGFARVYARLRTRFTPITLALFVVLGALSVSILFDDVISLYCFWAILALCLQS